MFAIPAPPPPPRASEGMWLRATDRHTSEGKQCLTSTWPLSSRHCFPCSVVLRVVRCHIIA